jgi:hypothetical protein
VRITTRWKAVTAKKISEQPMGYSDNSVVDQQVARQSKIGHKLDLNKQAFNYSHLSRVDVNENPYESSSFSNVTFVRCGAGSARRVFTRL